MEHWIVIGAIWMMTLICLTLFVRGASPARKRALALARVREARLQTQPEGDEAVLAQNH